MSPDPRALLGQASALHRAGRMAEALEVYRAAARLAPNFLDAQRMLAFALLQAGQPKDAVRVAQKARDLAPRDPNSHLLLGAGLLGLEAPAKALAAFDEAARLAPGLLEAHFQAGNALTALGRHAAAIERYNRALEIDPRSLEALTNRATAFARLGRHEEALADCERLIATQPWSPLHLVAKASTLLEMGRYAEALASAEAAIAAAPTYAEGYHVAGQAKAALGDLAAGTALIAKALDGDAGRPDVRVHLARLLRMQERFDEGLTQCDAVLKTAPRFVPALVERAELKRALGEASAAIADADVALSAQPDQAGAHLVRAAALGDIGLRQPMRVAVGRALRAAPKDPAALFATAAVDLARGAWTAGWAGYEQRENLLPPPFVPPDFPRWDGVTVPKDLIILAEQGIGDVLHFGRLLSLVADRGLPARLYAKPALAPLAAQLDPRIPVVTDLSAIPADAPGTFWLPLASLPKVFAPDPAMWPTVPYLQPPAERVAKWAHLKEGGGLAIGINWQGNPSRLIDVGRSAPLAAFAPLAAIPGVRLISLQHGAAAAQIAQVGFADRIQTLGEEVDGDGIFMDRAGILSQLDLLVTTDTSAAHLAGALGTRAFLALRAVPDWRWGETGEASVLYPSLRLFRQTTPGDWSDVFGQIAAAVRQLQLAAVV